MGNALTNPNSINNPRRIRDGKQKGWKREPKGAKGIPNGKKWEPNGCQKATKVEPKGGKGAQREPFAEQERTNEEKGAEKHADWCEKGA